MSNTISRVAVGIITIAMITALVLPGRQTAQVINAAGGVFNNSLGTAIKG